MAKFNDLLLAAFAVAVVARAQVEVSPFGLTAAMEADDTLEAAMTLANTSDRAVAFRIRTEEADRDLEARALRPLHSRDGLTRDPGVPAGFNGHYYQNQAGVAPEFGELVMERVDELINFDWGEGGPGGGVEPDYFGVRWDAYFVARQAGTYHFNTYNDDGVRLFIDGEQIIDDWWDHAPEERDGEIDLEPGLHRVVLEFYENGGGAVCHLRWDTPDNRELRYMTAYILPPWLAFDPDQGEIAAEDSREIAVAFQSTGLERGTYELVVVIETDHPEQGEIRMSALLTVDDDVAGVVGAVTDPARAAAPIPGTRVSTDRYLLARYTDDEGAYRLADLPLGRYRLTFAAPDYLPHSEDIDLDEAGEVELNVELLHAECDLNPDSVAAELARGESQRFNLTGENAGNGPLTYRVTRRLPGGADADPWTLRESSALGGVLQDSRLEGVVFTADTFYVSGGGNETNYIYVLDRNRRLVRRFRQPGDSPYGILDMAWDGRLLWGSGERTVYGFTPDGQVQAQFAGPERVNQALAWDPDRGVLWVAGITSAYITAYSPDGDQTARVPQFGMRVFGLAYWSDDPDGYPLYVLHSTPPAMTDQWLHKVRLGDRPDTMFVARLQPPAGGSPRGCEATNRYDVYSWVMMTMSNNADQDRLDIWQIQGNTSWMQVAPAAGVIEPQGRQDFTLTLDAGGLPDTTFFGRLVWVHDGVGGATAVNVAMRVLSGPRPPTVFDLVRPPDGDTLRTGEVTFAWEPSFDPNPGDTLRYQLWMQAAADSAMWGTADTTLTVSLDSLLADVPLPATVWWWVKAVSGGDVVECRQRFHFTVDVVGASERAALPRRLELEPVSPNPFNDRARVGFTLPEAGTVAVDVFDLAGRRVLRLADGWFAAGRHNLVLDARRLPAGVYVIRLTASGEVLRRKAAVVK